MNVRVVAGFAAYFVVAYVAAVALTGGPTHWSAESRTAAAEAPVVVALN